MIIILIIIIIIVTVVVVGIKQDHSRTVGLIILSKCFEGRMRGHCCFVSGGKRVKAKGKQLKMSVNWKDKGTQAEEEIWHHITVTVNDSYCNV